jgi:uncharacterized RDD family membrane protein YckC
VLGDGQMAADLAAVMNSRFQPDADSTPGPTPRLIDPDTFDASEQRFAASLEKESAQPQGRFVVECGSEDDLSPLPLDSGGVNCATPTENAGKEPGGESHGQASDPDSWRREVVARVNHYRGRRPRAPRYPSLQLKFESSEPPLIEQPGIGFSTAGATSGQLAISMDLEPPVVMELQTTQPMQAIPMTSPSDGAAKILEFPRSSLMPPVPVDELAEPVFHRPRILEVPEVLPAPPALGGMLIEATEKPQDERRPGFELPLKPARLTRRVLAGLTDAVLVAAALAAFGYIFLRITGIVPPLRETVSVAAALLATFWAAYQYLLLVHAGSTPGLKLAKLELNRFDGRPVPRRLRRWRVLASVLSGLSLALGYAWCFMDEDELCWHDRITHTYMAPKAGKVSAKP